MYDNLEIVVFIQCKWRLEEEYFFTLRGNGESVSICWYWNLYWHYNVVSPNVAVIWAAKAIKCYVQLKGFWSFVTISLRGDNMYFILRYVQLSNVCVLQEIIISFAIQFSMCTFKLKSKVAMKYLIKIGCNLLSS